MSSICSIILVYFDKALYSYRDPVIASKSTVEKENYEGSTDEESENLMQLTTSESSKVDQVAYIDVVTTIHFN